MDRERKVELWRKTIDYLFGFKIDETSSDLSTALKMTWLEWLKPNKIDYSKTTNENIDQITQDHIQYSLDLAKIYTHLFSSPDIHIDRVLRLPEKSGIYKFIIFADDRDHSLIEYGENDIIESSEKVKEILPDLVLEAGIEKNHSDIARKNKLGNMWLYIYGWGRINLDRENKTIRLYGYSGSYGKVSNHLVHRLVQELKDDWYKITVEMNVGY